MFDEGIPDYYIDCQASSYALMLHGHRLDPRILGDSMWYSHVPEFGPGWLNGYFSFVRRPYRDVITDWYGINEQRTTHDSPDNALESVKDSPNSGSRHQRSKGTYQDGRRLGTRGCPRTRGGLADLTHGGILVTAEPRWDPVFEAILRKLVPTLSPGQPLPPDLALRENGINSLSAVTLLSQLEDAYDLEFPVCLLTFDTFETPALCVLARTATLRPRGRPRVAAGVLGYYLRMTNAARRIDIPDKPSLDGLEAKWAARWDEDAVYAFDRSTARDQVFAIDTPPLTVSGSLHVGHVFSFTHTDTVARFQRMRGREVFYPIGWDDNGLATERRVQNYYGVRCEPALPYDPNLSLPGKPGKEQVPVSRRNFIELCQSLTEEDEKAFEYTWRRLGLSVDWSTKYQTIDEVSRRISQLAFLRNLARGEAYLSEAPTLWDVTFQTAVAQAELEDRERPGAFYNLVFHGRGDQDIEIATTRPELLPACVALVAHPDDERYKPLFGQSATTPVFGVEVPVIAHRLADPEKGTGMAMVCTFGDLTDVIWWRELQLATRPVIGRDGRFLPEPPRGFSPAASVRYGELAGATVFAARERVIAMSRESGELLGEPQPITHLVKFYEKGDRPLEIVTTRQWYIRNGSRDAALRERLLERGAELNWVPPHMRVRYDNWVSGLNSDWLVSRQRFFGVPIPVWYPLDADGDTVYDRPIVPSEEQLPVDPSVDTPVGYEPGQRGKPSGFIGDPDIFDTWATSSLTPQIAGRWGRDDKLFASVFPMDLRPQGHDIIRTWLFSTVLRAHYELGQPPWRSAAISGWILDPDRKKMSKSKGNVVTPADLLAEYGSDAVRYWAASSRPGTDTAFDTGQMKIGRRLAIKLLNASKFVLGIGEPGDDATVTEPIDGAMIAQLADTVRTSSEWFERYDYARALESIEDFFWNFCDNYVELVKERAYGDHSAAPGTDGAGTPSARLALRIALSTIIRLFAPFLPFATEEVWSWWQDGSVHRATWPKVAELDTMAKGSDPEILAAASNVIANVRKAKSEAKLSMRTEVSCVEIAAPTAVLRQVLAAEGDLRAAGRISMINPMPTQGDDLRVIVTL